MNTRKQQCLQNFFRAILTHEDTEPKLQELHKILQHDSPHLCLYKYCSISEFALSNILNNTLYCSPPNSFNDPFDAYIGWDVPYAVLSDDFANQLIRILEHTTEILRNQKSLTNINHELRDKVQQLLNNQRFIDIWQKANMSIQLTGEDIYDFLNALLNLSPEQSLTIAWNRQKEALVPILQNETVTTIIRENDDPQVAMQQIAQTIHPDVDVDNFDALILATGALLEHAYTEIQSMQNAADTIDNAIQNLRKQYKIGCLTTDYKNRLMWSHYGNSHQGICIEYDFANVNFLEAQTIPLPVYYSNARPYFALTSAAPFTSINEHLDNVALQSLFCKDQIWSYENEWRILIAADADSNYLMPPISCIYLGAAIPNTYKHIIINVAQKCNIPVKQMTLDRTTYDLHAKSISPIIPTSG